MSAVTLIGVVQAWPASAHGLSAPTGERSRLGKLLALADPLAAELADACKLAETGAQWYVIVDAGGKVDLDFVYRIPSAVHEWLDARVRTVFETASRVVVLLHDLGTSEWVEDSRGSEEFSPFMTDEYAGGGPLCTRVHRFLRQPGLH